MRYGFILARGTGTRLRPYTFILPKPLIPLGGESLEAMTSTRRRRLDAATNVKREQSAIVPWCMTDGDITGFSLASIPPFRSASRR